MYNKIFTKILDSSIWMEPLPTRIVWLTFIAAMDEHGFVSFASPSNVAHRAIVPLEDTLVALAALEGPDKNSSDPENEGRRLERVPGGWVVLNAHKYRALVTKAIIQDQVRDRVRAFRAKRCNAPVTVRNVPVTQENKCNVLVTPSVSVSGSVSGSEARIHARADDGDLCAPSTLPAVPASDADHWQMHERNQEWAKALKAASCKIGRDNWTAWKALVDAHGLNVTLSAAKGVLATERWPDRVESTLAASRGQENPGDVVKVVRMTL